MIVRFPCNECGKRLKAKVPPGTRKISTTCTACHKGMVANVSVTGGAGQTEQQSGRARHKAGEASEAQNGGLCDVKCMCMPSRRRLLVRHPLAQICQLIDDGQAKLDERK